MPPEDEEKKEKQGAKGWLHKYRFILIAVGIIVLVGVIIKVQSMNSSGLTIEGVWAQVRVNAANIGALTATTTSRDDQLAGNISNAKTDLQGQINSLVIPPDLSANVTSLQEQWLNLSAMLGELSAGLAAINEAFDSLRYASITGVTNETATVWVHGSGNFSVFVSLFGVGFNGTATTSAGTIASFGENTTLTAIVTSSWETGDEFTVSVNGTIEYASATIGQNG